MQWIKRRKGTYQEQWWCVAIVSVKSCTPRLLMPPEQPEKVTGILWCRGTVFALFGGLVTATVFFKRVRFAQACAENAARAGLVRREEAISTCSRMAQVVVDAKQHTLSLVGDPFYPLTVEFGTSPDKANYFGNVFHYDFSHTLYLVQCTIILRLHSKSHCATLLLPTHVNNCFYKQ